VAQVGCVEELLKALQILRDVEPIGEGVVDVDGDWHGAAAVCLGDLAEGDPRLRVAPAEVSRVRDGREV
jgi:hypothetical protein